MLSTLPVSPAFEVVKQLDGTYSVASGTHTLLFWTVRVGQHDLECIGNTEGECCWQYVLHARCKHTAAVVAFRREWELPRLEDMYLDCAQVMPH